MAHGMRWRQTLAKMGATLPVRFWNCHGGSARIVPNRCPRALARRSMCAEKGLLEENIEGPALSTLEASSTRIVFENLKRRVF